MHLSAKTIPVLYIRVFLGLVLSDAMTKMGVNVFYPFTTFKLRGPITTGTRAEALAAAFALGFAILFWSGF